MRFLAHFFWKLALGDLATLRTMLDLSLVLRHFQFHGLGQIEDLPLRIFLCLHPLQ